MHRSSLQRLFAPLVLAVPLAAVVSAGPAHADPVCGAAAQPVTDYAGTTFPYRYYCGTYVGSELYANVAGSKADLDDTGYMYRASEVWVLCQVKGRQNPVIQGNTNT